jgi:hypothetical protein
MPSLLVGGHVCVDQTDGASCARTFFKFFCCLYKCSCFIVADLCLLLEIAIGIGKKGSFKNLLHYNFQAMAPSSSEQQAVRISSDQFGAKMCYFFNQRMC